MATVNMLLQGKGGVGKSFIAGLLAQFYRARSIEAHCFDTDPVNATFAGFPAYQVQRVRLGETADEINPRAFDELMASLMDIPDDAVAVIDNGASTFLPLLSYLAENDATAVLADGGHEVRIHAVLTGGQAFDDTLHGLGKIFDYFPNVAVVVWLNEYFGRVEKTDPTGKVRRFEESALYRKNEDRIHGLVTLPEVRRETFGHDIEAMLRARLTFDQAIADPALNLMARQRLKRTWRTLFEAMERSQL